MGGGAARSRRATMAPRARASTIMMAAKGGATLSVPDPEPEDKDEEKIDPELEKQRWNELNMLLKKTRKEKEENYQRSIDAVKSEYGELEGAKDLLWVSFEEPRQDRQNLKFNKNEYSNMLERL